LHAHGLKLGSFKWLDCTISCGKCSCTEVQYKRSALFATIVASFMNCVLNARACYRTCPYLLPLVQSPDTDFTPCLAASHSLTRKEVTDFLSKMRFICQDVHHTWLQLLMLCELLFELACRIHQMQGFIPDLLILLIALPSL